MAIAPVSGSAGSSGSVQPVHTRLESVKGVSDEEKVNGVSREKRVGEQPEENKANKEKADEVDKKHEEVKGVKEVDVKA
jgi:hypothetical protein